MSVIELPLYRGFPDSFIELLEEAFGSATWTGKVPSWETMAGPLTASFTPVNVTAVGGRRVNAVITVAHRLVLESPDEASAVVARLNTPPGLGTAYVVPEAPTNVEVVSRIGQEAKLPFPVHPYMLRHACGFKLANDGHDTRALQLWLGHRNIHTVRYTELTPARFKGFWRD